MWELTGGRIHQNAAIQSIEIPKGSGVFAVRTSAKDSSKALLWQNRRNRTVRMNNPVIDEVQVLLEQCAELRAILEKRRYQISQPCMLQTSITCGEVSDTGEHSAKRRSLPPATDFEGRP